MADNFWETQDPNTHIIRAEGGEAIAVAARPIGSIAADAGNFVWRPGGVQSGNVFNNFPDLATAIAKVDGEKTVGVDTSIAAAHIVAGTYAGITDVTFVGHANSESPTITIDDGAHFTYPTQGRLGFHNINVANASTTAPFISLVGTEVLVLIVEVANLQESGGTKPIVDVGGSAQMVVQSQSSVLGAGVFNLSSVTAALSGLLLLLTNVATNAFAATAAGTMILTADGSTQPVFSPTQGSGVATPAIAVTNPLPTFVFRPGSTGGDGNVFTTWAALYAAASATAGPVWILVDDTLAAAHVTAGGPYNIDNWHFSSKLHTTGGNSLLIWDEGATATWTVFYVERVTFAFAMSATPVFSPTTFVNIILGVDAGFGSASSTETVPFVAVQNGGTCQVRAVNGSGTTIGDGTHAPFSLVAGASLFIALRSNGPNLQANAVSGGAGTFTLSVDPSATFSATQSPAPTVTFTGKAAQVAYTPATGGNWNPSPTLASAALDQLAAPNVVQATGNTGTGSGTVTVTTGNITKAKNGSMQVSASALVSTSAAATITVQLKRDAGNIGTAKTLVAGAAVGGIDLNISFIDTAPDTAAHTYTLSVSASAGNITCAANSAQISVSEGS